MAKPKKTVTGRVLHDPVKDNLRPIYPLDLSKTKTIDQLVRAMGDTVPDVDDPEDLKRFFLAAIPENLGYRQRRNLWLIGAFFGVGKPGRPRPAGRPQPAVFKRASAR